MYWGFDPSIFNFGELGDWFTQPTVPRYLALQRLAGWDHLGYGTFGLNLSKGLKALNVHITEPEGDHDFLRVPENYQTVVRAALPTYTAGCWEGQFVVLYTMWEADHLPPSLVEKLHNFDMIVVPNDQNRDLFSEHHDNVRKVPLGYDTTFWTKQERKLPEARFNFLWCGAGAAEMSRKGPDLAIAGFKAAFPQWESMSPRPRLLLKCLQGDVASPPNFCEVLTGRWPREQLLELYGRAHALVMPSRGEGWGYHPQQAVGTGMPAILSAIPGHTEYSWLPGFYEVEVGRSKAKTFLYGDPGSWWEPDLDALIEGYKALYFNYERWLEDAQTGHEGMVSQFSHRRMAKNLCSAIGDERLVMSETGPWQAFSRQRFAAATTKHLGPEDCCVSGVRYNWVPGETQWVPAEVRRVLDDAGYLVPGLSESGIIGSCPHRPGVVG